MSAGRRVPFPDYNRAMAVMHRVDVLAVSTNSRDVLRARLGGVALAGHLQALDRLPGAHPGRSS